MAKVPIANATVSTGVNKQTKPTKQTDNHVEKRGRKSNCYNLNEFLLTFYRQEDFKANQKTKRYYWDGIEMKEKKRI